MRHASTVELHRHVDSGAGVRLWTGKENLAMRLLEQCGPSTPVRSAHVFLQFPAEGEKKKHTQSK